MSLNGLDAPVLTEAFGKACAEPGSWYVICRRFIRFNHQVENSILHEALFN